MNDQRRRSSFARLRMTCFLSLLATEIVSSPAHAEETISSATEVSVEVAEPEYDGYQSLLDWEAHVALAKGDYRRAWHFFWRLLQIDPYDTRAMRECGRIAHAMGEFNHAVDMLGRAYALSPRLPDPELHYLRGEALIVLGRTADGQRSLDKAEAEIGDAPSDRRHVLWLARILALRGDVDGALARYDSQLARGSTVDTHAEVALLRIETYALNKRWADAERELRGFLRDRPDHQRGREMLAWVLDARGKLDESTAVRAVLAEEWVDHARRTEEYARSLERSLRYPEALAQYRHAERLGVDELDDEIDRLERRLAPEIAGGLVRRDDPSGSIDGFSVGASIPLHRRTRVTLTGTRETTSGGPSVVMTQGTMTAATASAIVDGKHGGMLGAGVTAQQIDDGSESAIGASAFLRTSPRHQLQLHTRLDYDLPWRESASTIRNGGRYDAASLQLYATPESRRVLLSGGGQFRRLSLTAEGVDAMDADQIFAFAGLDWVPWRKPERATRAEVFDEEMIAPRALASSAVLSLRHYEMWSDNPFGQQLFLIERSSIDEVSGILRHVLDRGGRLGAELRGGLGYDWGREVRIWRAGASALLSATASSRLTLDYDVASESGTGLSGRRHAGQVVLHVDL
ncbi:MAG: tetratricopeptide repeat protein [Kofleriaceae bacterium]|nr:MAG: tetratricopeptide repeat protein [Kofleriaceae bacterium]